MLDLHVCSLLIVATRQCQDEIYRLMARDTFPRFIKLVTVQQNLSLAVSKAMWWNDPNITLSVFFSFPSPINEVGAPALLIAFFVTIETVAILKYLILVFSLAALSL